MYGVPTTASQVRDRSDSTLESTVSTLPSLLRHVKLEPPDPVVIVLSDESDSDSPPVHYLSTSPPLYSSGSSTQVPLCPSSTPITPTVPVLVNSEPSLPTPAPSPFMSNDSGYTTSILDSLRRLSVQRGAKSALSKLDYNKIPVIRRDSLLA